MAGCSDPTWVTYALTDADAEAAIILANSIRDTLSGCNTAIFVSLRIEPYYRKLVRAEFDLMIMLDEETIPGPLTVEEYIRLRTIQLMQFTKCFFLEPTSLVFRNDDDGLFDLGVERPLIPPVKPRKKNTEQIFGVRCSAKLYDHVVKLKARKGVWGNVNPENKGSPA